ncbi:hypothetical protein M422DRAFT_160247 [Sphaerobolus stellatus SS14]|nr:hypothetical protein M422DRAFT_160247 [Sphaerobolus stellatus SS14]
MPLANLPQKLLEEIIGNIDKPTDLLSLSLSSKSTSKLVIPDHLDYRVIQCAPSDTQVWQHLIKHPHLARRVKSVRILPGLI